MKKRLLVVDNDVEMEEIFKEIFSDKGYEVIFYEDVEDIIQLLEQHNPDIVVLDYNLNGINGGELCRQIKNDVNKNHIPVILFSAFPKIIYRPQNYGYNAFIEKPFDIDELFSIIEDNLTNSKHPE